MQQQKKWYAIMEKPFKDIAPSFVLSQKEKKTD